MRSLSRFVLLLFLAAPALAGPVLVFHPEREQTNADFAVHFFLRNDGDEPARDVTVSIEVGPTGLGLDTRDMIHDWTCISTATTATCATPSFAPGAHVAGVVFLRQTDGIGGHRTFTGRLTARDLPPQSFTIDIVKNHRVRVT